MVKIEQFRFKRMLVFCLGVFLGCQTLKEPTAKEDFFERILNNDVGGIRDILYPEDVNRKGTAGVSPLHYAVAKNQDVIVKMLLERGAFVDDRDDYGQTPLHYAIENNLDKISLELVRANASLFIRDYKNDSPLDLALRSKNGTFVNILTPTTIKQRDENGRSPLYAILKSGRKDFFDLFFSIQGTPGKEYSEQENVLESLLLEKNDFSLNLNLIQDLIQNKKFRLKLPEFQYFQEFILANNFNYLYPDSSRPIHKAIQAGHNNIVNWLLSRNINPDLKDYFGNTPLHTSIKSNNEISFDLLLLYKANPDEVDNEKNSLLHAALNPTISETLLRKVLALKRPLFAYSNTAGHNALHLAALINFPVVQTRLIWDQKIFPSIDEQDNFGNTPLLLSMKQRHYDLARFFISQQANVFVYDQENNSPLTIAMRSPEVLNWFFTNRLLFSKDNKGNSPLHLAIQFENVPALNFFLNQGVPINAQNQLGNTPLHLALLSKNSTLITLLLDKNASLFQKNYEGLSALSLIFEGGLGFMDLYLRGNTLKLKDEAGNNLIQQAVLENRYDALLFLIQKNVNFNEKNIQGQTPLHNAVRADFLAGVKYLFEQKALLNERDYMGNTPLHYAVKWENMPILQYLVQVGAQSGIKNNYGRTILHDAVLLENLPITQFILEKSPTILDYVDQESFTALFYAIQKENEKIFDLLLSAETNIYVRDNDGNTPLHFAILKPLKPYFYTQLVQKGANLLAENKNGQSPYTVALQNGLEMVQKIITEKNINLQNEQGDTLMHLAIKYSAKSDILRYLLSLNPRLDLNNRFDISVNDLASQYGINLNELRRSQNDR